MVYDKKRSGDPDYDDKQPPAEHGRVVTAGDGTQVLISDSLGPTTMAGAHYAFDAPDLADHPDDNRPEPGGVADATSGVQSYGSDSAPTQKMTEADYRAEVADGNGGLAGSAPVVAPKTAPAKAATAAPKKN